MDQNDYRRKIYNCESAIDDCRRDIKEFEENISQLNILKRKLKSLSKNVEKSKNKGQKDIQRLKAVLSVGRTLFRGRFFTSVKNVFSDSKYIKAKNEIASNISAVDKKLQFYEGEISKKREEMALLINTINNCREEIRVLDMQEGDQ